MSIKITIPNSSSDVLTFGSGNTPTAAQIAGIDSGSSNGQLALYTTASGTSTERVRINASGNVGIGTSSPFAKLSAEQAGGNLITARYNSSNAPTGIFIGATSGAGFFGSNLTWSSGNTFNYATSSNPTYWIGNPGGQAALCFGYGSGTAGTDALTSTERMRIDSSGNLILGKTTASAAGNGFYCDNSGAMVATIAASNTYHVYSSANSTYRFYVNVNGGISNFSANNVNLSDERVKKNIELSGNYLAKICAIPVKLFNYKDEAEGEQRTLGVIAQDVEAVAPELVNNDGWVGEEPEDGVPLKTIYQTDLQYALMKCIQEQQAIITSLTDRVSALDERLTALENK